MDFKVVIRTLSHDSGRGTPSRGEPKRAYSNSAPNPCQKRQSIELSVGAGRGNRTLVFSLEGCCSTIELHPRRDAPQDLSGGAPDSWQAWAAKSMRERPSRARGCRSRLATRPLALPRHAAASRTRRRGAKAASTPGARRSRADGSRRRPSGCSTRRFAGFRAFNPTFCRAKLLCGPDDVGTANRSAPGDRCRKKDRRGRREA